MLPIPKAWIIEKPTLNNHFYHITPYGSLGGVVLTVPAEDFIYFKDVDLNDPYGNGKGMSESIADELETDEYASKYQKNFFFNDATPPYVVTGFQGNEVSATQIKKSLMEKIGGFRKAREPAVLTGAMDVKPLGISPKELDMVQSRKFLRDECLQHYQIPPEAFGIVENSNRATIESSLFLAQKNVFVPRLRFFERVLNNQLLNEYDDLICRHDIHIIEDKELQLRIYQFGVQNACITKEQFCEQFGINPEPDEGHYIVPVGATIIPVGEEFNLEDIPYPEDAPKPEEEPPEEEPITTDDEDKKKALKGSAGRVLNQKKERDEWRTKIWNNFDIKARSNEPMFVSAIKRIAKKQATDILGKIGSLEEVNDAVVNNLCNDYFQKECNEAVKRGLAKCWLDSMNSGRELAKLALEGKKDITIISDLIIENDAFNKWVEKYGLAKSTELNQTTKRELLKKLRKTLAEGTTESMGNLKKQLQESAKEVFEELSNTRAYLIARTETGSSVNVGQLATYQATGIERKEWISTLDDRTRESHLQMDGMIADIDATFEVENYTDGGVDNMLYPLDPNGSAGNVCNCRCTIAPVIA